MKIRKDNDFVLNWAINWNGVAEDFTGVTDIVITASVFGSVKPIPDTSYSIIGNIVRIEFTPEICNIPGVYRLELKYSKQSSEFVDGERRSAVDVKAFQIVETSDNADTTHDLSSTSDAVAGFALKYDDLTEEQKDELRGKGITSIELSTQDGDTKTYTITYADGETFDFDVRDGHSPVFTFSGTVLLIDGVPQVNLKGETGNGIASIELTSTVGLVKTYTITFTDLTTTTFIVTDGSTPVLTFQGTTIYVNGVAGPNLKGETGNGISAVTLLSTAGLAKTYRITFTDSTTFDYVVTDGAAGVGAAVVQTTGASINDVMSQKAVTDDLALKASHGYASAPKTLKEVDDSLAQLAGEVNEKIYKTVNIGASGLVTIKPTTTYYTYKLNVLDNVTINIDLTKMIQQVGNARCRLIIDMPILKTITITKPLLWGGTAPTFAAAGQYIFEIIDVDGTGTPLIWQVASTTKAEPTGNILFVDSTGADYSVGQINAGTPTRTTSSWASPFKYLQNAINAAQAGDIIFVKQGIYKPTHLRTTPTSYADGDRLNRNATFTPKNGVDIYGGFVGTETKTWQRVMDANGYPVAKTILCGDIAGEAAVDPAKTVGDTRTDASKANAAYNVVFGKAISALTYLNGVNVRYGNASEASGDQASGGGIYSAPLLIGINNTAYNNTTTSGGGWRDGTNTNCTAYSNTAATSGGGWYGGTNTNCTSYNNTSANGGGWTAGTNTNCTAYSNTAVTSGGGWYGGTNTNCTAYNNTTTSGGGWRDGTNTNCTAYSNTAVIGGGWRYGTNTNCTSYNNTSANGGGWGEGTNTNCTGVNNKALQAVFGATTSDTNINCLLYNNKTAAGAAVGFDDKTASGVKIFRNNAYDVAHPTIAGGAGSDINTATCIANLTAEQAKIEVPTFIGAAETPEQLAELKAYAATITTKLKPKAGSVLKGAGVNNTTYPNPTDYDGKERPEASTIGILEGE